MKLKRISTRLLIIILPVIIFSLIILSLFGALNSRSIIEEKTSDGMSASLGKSVGEVMDELISIETTANVIANMVASNYKTTDMDSYEETLKHIVSGNPTALGSGLWFEPYAYDSKEEYMGPYVYKDGNSLVTTYDYSNAEYDYFTQEYYTLPKETMSTIITNRLSPAPRLMPTKQEA